MTALLIICKEKALVSLSAFEDELFSAICYAPSRCLSKEVMAAGAFCWGWLSNLPEFPKDLLYLNLSYSILLATNAGGIFDSKSIQSALVGSDRENSRVMDQQEFVGCPEVMHQKVNEYTARLLHKIRTDRLSTLSYSEHYYYTSRDDVLEGLNVWLKFIENQLKVIGFAECAVCRRLKEATRNTY